MDEVVAAVRETHRPCENFDPDCDNCRITALIKTIDRLETVGAINRSAWEEMTHEVYEWMDIACLFAVVFSGVKVELDESRKEIYEKFFDLVDVLTDHYGMEYFPESFNKWMGRES